MTVLGLLNTLEGLGVTATVTPSGNLRLSPASVISPELLEAVRLEKSALLAALTLHVCAACRHLDREAARRDGWPEGMGVCRLGWAAHGEADIPHPGVPLPVMSGGAHCMAQDGSAWRQA